MDYRRRRKVILPVLSLLVALTLAVAAHPHFDCFPRQPLLSAMQQLEVIFATPFWRAAISTCDDWRIGSRLNQKRFLGLRRCMV
jgi:hypothetical protein